MTNVVLLQQQRELYCVSFNKSLCAGGAFRYTQKEKKAFLISFKCDSSLAGWGRGAQHNAAVGRWLKLSPLVGFHFISPTGPVHPSLCVWVHLQWRICFQGHWGCLVAPTHAQPNRTVHALDRGATVWLGRPLLDKTSRFFCQRFDELHCFLFHPQRYGVTAQPVRQKVMSVRRMAPAWRPRITWQARSNTYASASTGTAWFPPDSRSIAWVLKVCWTHTAAMRITATASTWKFPVRLVHQTPQRCYTSSSSHLHQCLPLAFALVPTKEGELAGSSWGPVELVAVIAGPVFLLCVLLMVGVFLFQYHQRAYSHRQRLEVEDPSCDHIYLPKDKTLQDLIYDMSTSGSGSGQCLDDLNPK